MNDPYIFQENPQKLSNNSDSQNHLFENDNNVTLRKTIDKNNLNKKSSPQSAARIYNKSSTPGKRETYENSRKTAAEDNHYDVQDYKGGKFVI